MFAFVLENLRLALRNLYLHRLRTLLTALGIIIGVAAVIVMAAIGEGTKQQAIAQMQQLGARNILIRSIPPPETAQSSSSSSRTFSYGLTYTDLGQIRSISDVDEIVALRDSQQSVVYEGQRFPGLTAIAVTPNYFNVVNLRLSRGNYLSDMHQESATPVCVLGFDAARQIFPSEDPIGQTITVGSGFSRDFQAKVIGVLEPTGLRAGTDNAGIMLRDIDRDVYFPLSVSEQIYGSLILRRTAGQFERKDIQLSEIWIRTKGMAEVESMSSIYSNLLGLPGRTDVQVKAPIEILRKAEQMNRMFNFIMVGTASFALLVGGIGIMNIMLATVTERTREIGIRRALGAKQSHITLQFLIETTMISLAGGGMGIMLGVVSAWALPWIISFSEQMIFGSRSGSTYPTSLAAWSIVASCVVSGCIGISFGLYPAMKAARMNPIEALRHE